ncbi:MAG: RloB family protein [Bacteroidia bacterium]|nr:RloB family protein [Bacteroidia bacterium]
MKDKKSTQIAQKEVHKAKLKESKIRRTAPSFQIPKPTRVERQRFLIVCEGLSTEPDYFYHLRQYFRITAAEIVSIGGAGETIRVVERAKKEAGKSPFDQIWVVFDKDDFPSDHFDNAIRMAEAAKFGVAYSNQAFEYWLILHFEDHQGGAMHRNQYSEKLKTYLSQHNVFYDTRDQKSINTEMFRVLVGKDPKIDKNRLDLAIIRAEKVLGFHSPLFSPASAESSTTVFRLVRELLKFL